jgi:uncharacterized LabA/DUF88 family protein
MLYVFVDWENIRRSLLTRYVEEIPIARVLDAIEKVAEEVGGFHRAIVYGDFTLRGADARQVERKPHFECHYVLRSLTKKDRADAAIIADMMEKLLQEPQLDKILLCSGDSDYCDVVRRAIGLGKDFFICAVAGSAALDLISLAPLYPLEKFMEMPLTLRRPRTTTEIIADRVMNWKGFVVVMDQLERKLPYVGAKYLRDKILPMYQFGGPSLEERFAYLEMAKELGLILIGEVEDKTRSEFAITVAKLNRENDTVRKILEVT